MNTNNTPKEDMNMPTNNAEKKTSPRTPRTSGSSPSESKKETPVVESTLADFSPELTPFQQQIAARLAGLYMLAGSIRLTFNAYDGILIMETAEKRAEEVIRYARTNKKLWHLLVRLLNATDLGNMIVGHSLIIMAIVLQHRGMGEHPILRLNHLNESHVMATWMQRQTDTASYMDGNMSDGTATGSEFSGVNP
jgi:hypothetical protein